MTDELPDLTLGEDELAGRLQSARGLPTPAFRGALGRRLEGEDPGFRPRPGNLWVQVALLALAAVILLGAGVLLSVGGF